MRARRSHENSSFLQTELTFFSYSPPPHTFRERQCNSPYLHHKNIHTRVWMVCLDSKPAPRFCHSALINQEQMIIFGGANSKGFCTGHLYALKLARPPNIPIAFRTTEITIPSLLKQINLFKEQAANLRRQDFIRNIQARTGLGCATRMSPSLSPPSNFRHFKVGNITDLGL